MMKQGPGCTPASPIRVRGKGVRIAATGKRFPHGGVVAVRVGANPETGAADVALLRRARC
jgi:hypothetical protein